jgi:hypothetical protein
MSLNVFVPEAGDKIEAEEKAFNANFRVKIETYDDDDGSDVDVIEFEMHKQIVQGNIFHGVLNEVEVEAE